MALQYNLQRVAGGGELLHLAVERCDLAVQRADELSLRLDIPVEQLQFVHRSTLVPLGLLEHLVGLLNLLLKLPLFLLQILHAIRSPNGSKE